MDPLAPSRARRPLDPDPLVRGGALAALLALAITLLTLGLTLYRPAIAAAQPQPAVTADQTNTSP